MNINVVNDGLIRLFSLLYFLSEVNNHMNLKADKSNVKCMTIGMHALIT